jgi:hypothetical protein
MNTQEVLEWVSACLVEVERDLWVATYNGHEYSEFNCPDSRTAGQLRARRERLERAESYLVARLAR